MNQSRYGSYFALITLFLLIILFFLYLQDYFNPQGKISISSNNKQSLHLVSRQGHYVSKGYINGVPVTFLVDTGASMIAVSEKVADKANLRRGVTMEISTANGRISAYSTTIPNLEISTIQVQEIPAVIMPNMDNQVLLGMNFLRYFNWKKENNELILELK